MAESILSLSFKPHCQLSFKLCLLAKYAQENGAKQPLCGTVCMTLVVYLSAMFTKMSENEQLAISNLQLKHEADIMVIFVEEVSIKLLRETHQY